jgi:Flp pilus assembly protein TadB
MTQVFASTSLPELGVVLGTVFTGFGAMLVGFYKYASAREKDFEQSRQIAAKAYEKSNDKLGVALDRVADATENSAKEAAERNGHLAELQIEARQHIMDSLDRIHVSIGKQSVNSQTVKHQHIESVE